MTRYFDSIVLTCEHGGNEVPQAYSALFDGAANVLATHRGWDIGALAIAEGLAANLGAPLHASKTTRLLIDLNRSLHVKEVWSEWSSKLDMDTKATIIEHYYRPYRSGVESQLKQLVANNQRVLHLSLHTFTPVLNGGARSAEVGILYDPKRACEAQLARALSSELRTVDRSLRVRRNYPYVGYTDGFTTFLRRELAEKYYAGIEIETNQKELLTSAGQRRFIDIYTRAIQSLRD